MGDIEISDNRYNHVVHLQSAAIGAEKFYTTEDHTARFEGLELARERDNNAMEAWRDHPYVDIIDNRADFDSKMNRLVDVVVRRIGIDVGDLHLHRQEAGAPGPDRGSKAADLPEGLRQPAGAQRRQPPARLQDQALVPVREPTVPAGHLQGTLPLPLPGSRPPRDVHH